MALRPVKFWKLTLAEFDAFCTGYHRRQVQEWERTRWLGAVLVNINRAAGSSPVSVAELLALPGDPPWQPSLTEKEFDETMARLAEFNDLKIP